MKKVKRSVLSVFLLLISAMIVVVLITFSFPIVSASIKIEKIPVYDVIAAELDSPASFNMSITNIGPTDAFQIYTLLDIMFSPKGYFRIKEAEKKNFILQVFPGEKIKERVRGDYVFTYYIKNSETTQDHLTLKILPLTQIIDVVFPSSIKGRDEEVTILLLNRENIAFDNVNVKIESDILNKEFDASLDAKEEKEIKFSVDLFYMNAGTYPIKIELTIDGVTVEIEKQVLLEETSKVATEEIKSGNIFYSVLSIKKTNEGNKVEEIKIAIRKNAFARVFTSFNIKPDSQTREKTGIIFTWKKELQAGEIFEIRAKTNYLLPIFILLVIVILAYFINSYYKTELVLKKKAVKVKTKGGEFALKVMLFAKARKPITEVKVEDKLPAISELHERFGSVVPKIDKTKRKLEWNIKKLGRNEEHVFSYIIYSKISVIGRLEIPMAKASYKNKQGKAKTTNSNRVFILSEEKVV